jgi:hypothetical protein
MIRKICGPIKQEEQWIIRNNEEIDEILKKEDLVNYHLLGDDNLHSHRLGNLKSYKI